MFSILVRIGLISIPSIINCLLLSNYVSAFQIDIEGEDVTARKYLRDLRLCNDLDAATQIPPMLFAVQTPATDCISNGADDNWVLEELEAFTSPHSYFAVRGPSGEYIIHRDLETENPPSINFRSGAPGIYEGNRYVKSEFWILRHGELQLINEYNPVQDRDLLVLAGPGNLDSRTRFLLMRTPNEISKELRPGDYKYPLYAALPNELSSIPPEAEILVYAIYIRLSGAHGEVVIGDQIKIPAQNDQKESMNLFSDERGKDWAQTYHEKDTSPPLELDNIIDTEAEYENPITDELKLQPIGLEDLRLRRSIPKKPSPENLDNIEFLKRILEGSKGSGGSQLPDYQSPQDQWPSGLGSRLPGQIGPPGSGAGAYGAPYLSSPFNDVQYYHRPPEFGADGTLNMYAPIAVRNYLPPSSRSGPPFDQPFFEDDDVNDDNLSANGDEGRSDGNEIPSTGPTKRSMDRNEEVTEDMGRAAAEEIEADEYPDDGNIALEDLSEGSSSEDGVRFEYQADPRSGDSPDIEWEEQVWMYDQDPDQMTPVSNQESGGYREVSDDTIVDEVEAMPGDDSWDSTDRSYDSLLTDWDENGLDRLPSSRVKGSIEMRDFLALPTFEIGLPEDSEPRLSKWRRFRNVFSRKPKVKKVVKELTGFE